MPSLDKKKSNNVVPHGEQSCELAGAGESGGEASAGTAQPAAPQPDETAGSVPESLPFAVDEADHAETPQRAYEDVAPVLRLLAAAMGKEPSELRIWDPFFCTGAPSRRSLSLSISFRWG